MHRKGKTKRGELLAKWQGSLERSLTNRQFEDLHCLLSEVRGAIDRYLEEQAELPFSEEVEAKPVTNKVMSSDKQELLAKMQFLREQGLTYQAIADRLGTYPVKVMRWLNGG